MKNLTYPSFTLEEYLLREEQSEYRNEFLNGEIEAMAGESPNHSRIVHNIHVLLGRVLGERDCDVFTSNMKVYIPENNKMYYPDISVVCGDIQMALDRNDMIANPMLLFEVLSNSTAKFDQGEKFEDYKTLESLQEYVLIDQYKVHIQVNAKKEGLWRAATYRDPHESIYLTSIDAFLPIPSLYRRVEL